MAETCSICSGPDPVARLAGESTLYCWDCADDRNYPVNTGIVDVSWDPIVGTWSVDPCPDCGAGSGEACAWACSSNWDAEERSLAGEG